MHQAPLVSVVIITRNRPDPLHRCIKSILDNTFKNIEIIVLDNGLVEHSNITQKFLTELQAPCPIQYVKTNPKGFARLRQEAMQYVHGDFVMSIDDDCVAHSETISRIVDCFLSDSQIGIVGGEIDNITVDGTQSFKGRGKIGRNGQFIGVEDHKKAEAFGAANMSLRKSAYDAVGGYDLFFDAGMEEVDLTFSIRHLGYHLLFNPDIKITHYHIPSSLRTYNLWNNIQTARLYFFFKHFMPQNIHQWFEFLFNEVILLAQDIQVFITSFMIFMKRYNKGLLHKKNIVKLPNNTKANTGSRTQKLNKFGMVFTSRLMIPVLIHKAHLKRVELILQKAQKG